MKLSACEGIWAIFGIRLRL